MMTIKRQCCLLFFLISNVQCLQGIIDFTPPVVAIGTAAAEPVIQVTAEVLQSMVTSAVSMAQAGGGQAISVAIFKSFMTSWLPTLLVGAVVLYAGVMGIKMLKEAILDVINTPGNSKKAAETAVIVDGKVDDLGEKVAEIVSGLGELKQNFDTKMTAMRTDIINTIKQHVQEVFEKFAGEQNKKFEEICKGEVKTQQAVAEVKLTVEKISPAITKKIGELKEQQAMIAKQIHSMDGATKEQYEDIKGSLKDINGRVADLCFLIDGLDLPTRLQKTEQTEEFVAHHVGSIHQTTEENNHLLTAMAGQSNIAAQETHRSTAQLYGSGIFSQLIRPELEKIGQRQEALEQKLEQYVSKFSEQGQGLRNSTIAGGDFASSVAMAVEKQLQPLISRFTHVLEDAESEKQQLQRELAQYRTFFCILASNYNKGRADEQSSSEFSCQQAYYPVAELSKPFIVPSLSVLNRHSSVYSAIGLNGTRSCKATVLSDDTN